MAGPEEAIIMFVFVNVYQQIENHILQPIIYRRTVSLSSARSAASRRIAASGCSLKYGRDVQMRSPSLTARRQLGVASASHWSMSGRDAS